MSYDISPTPHATLSSALTQTPASTSVAYPMIFEGTDDIEGLYRQSGTVTTSIATPCVVAWTGHKLAINAVVIFSTTIALPTGITAGTPYYIISTGFTTDQFQISTSLGGAAVNTSGSQSGVHTCTCVSRIYASQNGDYLFNLSAIIGTATNTDATFDVWFVKGNSTDNLTGTNIDKSNTQVLMVTTGQRVVLAVPLIFDLDKGDFVRVDMRTGSAGNLSMQAVAAASTPTRPACPSVILTINKTGR